jgi:MFS family permease
MTDTLRSVARFAESAFRVGRVFNRAFSVFSRNLLPFSLITAVASLPNLLILTFQTGDAKIAPINGAAAAGKFGFVFVLAIVLYALSQATLLYAAFEDMRGRRVNLIDSMRIGLRRFLAILGVAISSAILIGFASILLVIPGLIVFTMIFVATPVCVVEKLGPSKSMSRSAALTKGNRWKIFGLWFVTLAGGTIAQSVLLKLIVVFGGGTLLGTIFWFVWSAVFGAFYAILVVVTYHDLRVAKEGVDTDQIAAVFD